MCLLQRLFPYEFSKGGADAVFRGYEGVHLGSSENPALASFLGKQVQIGCVFGCEEGFDCSQRVLHMSPKTGFLMRRHAEQRGTERSVPRFSSC